MTCIVNYIRSQEPWGRVYLHATYYSLDRTFASNLPGSDFLNGDPIPWSLILLDTAAYSVLDGVFPLGLTHGPSVANRWMISGLVMATWRSWIS